MCDYLLICKLVRLPGYKITAQVGQLSRTWNNRIENVLYLQPQAPGQYQNGEFSIMYSQDTVSKVPFSG